MDIHLIIKVKRAFSTLVMLLFCLLVSGQILINEFSAANSSILADPDYNDYADWIELYNSGSSDQNLKSYSISDDFAFPNKWIIDLDTIIPAGGHIINYND